jgi:hypothetical protein
MNIIVLEQTPEKLVLRVQDTSIIIGLGFCFFGLGPFCFGGLFTIGGIVSLLTGKPSYSNYLIDIAQFIIFFGLFIAGILWLYGSISFFKDTRWTFDRSLRKLFIKNAKFLTASRYPHECSYNEIRTVITDLKRLTNSRAGSTFSTTYEVYRLSIILASNKEMIITDDEKTPINQERQ